MDDNKLVILLPSGSHIDELKQKGIDIEAELSRIVFDNLELIKRGQNPKVTNEQMNDLARYGIDGPGYITAAFRKELHERLKKK